MLLNIENYEKLDDRLREISLLELMGGMPRTNGADYEGLRKPP